MAAVRIGRMRTLLVLLGVLVLFNNTRGQAPVAATKPKVFRGYEVVRVDRFAVGVWKDNAFAFIYSKDMTPGERNTFGVLPPEQAKVFQEQYERIHADQQAQSKFVTQEATRQKTPEEIEARRLENERLAAEYQQRLQAEQVARVGTMQPQVRPLPGTQTAFRPMSPLDDDTPDTPSRSTASVNRTTQPKGQRKEGNGVMEHTTARSRTEYTEKQAEQERLRKEKEDMTGKNEKEGRPVRN
jgi:hypothetical protein